jgi:hypothetical protein
MGTKELEALWSDLAGEDAGRAHAAVWALAAAPGKAVPLIRGRLKPAARPDPERMRRLVADLDNDRFAVRQAAARELEKLGGEASPALRQALAGNPSLEVRKGVEELLSKARFLRSGEVLRGVRGIEVLERIGTPEAREVLGSLAEGSPEVRLTREAQVSLERLARGPAVQP